MASLFELFDTDEDLELKGVQVDYDGTWFTIKRAGGANVEFSKALAQIRKKYQFRIENQLLDGDQAVRVIAEAYADTVVVGWGSDEYGEGKIKGPDGKPLEFSRDNVVKVLTHPKLRSLFADLQVQAGKIALFRREVLEDEAKN